MKMLPTVLAAALCCCSPQTPARLPLGTASLDGPKGRTMLPVVVATAGDDQIHLVAGSSCEDLITFRNYPNFVWDARDNWWSYGAPHSQAGEGVLTLMNYGDAKTAAWEPRDAASARLYPEGGNSADEFSGTIELDIDATVWNLRFHAPRINNMLGPSDPVLWGDQPLCDGHDVLSKLACCNWDTVHWQQTVNGRWPACAFAACETLKVSK